MEVLILPDSRGRRLRVNNVARRLNRPVRTVRDWAAKKKLPGFKEGPKVWFFWEQDVETFKRGLNEGNPEEPCV